MHIIQKLAKYNPRPFFVSPLHERWLQRYLQSCSLKQRTFSLPLPTNFFDNHLQYIVIVIISRPLLTTSSLVPFQLQSLFWQPESFHQPSIPSIPSCTCTCNHFYNLLIESRNASTSFLEIPSSPRPQHSLTRSQWARKSTMSMSSPLLQHDSHHSTWKTDPPSPPSNPYHVPRRECRRPRHDQYRLATTTLPRCNKIAVCSYLHCQHWHR